MQDSLYQQICDQDLLIQSWQDVKAKGSAGGIDGETLDTFAANLQDNIQKLHNELVNGTFVPQPYRKVDIPKDDNETRTLGLMSVRDKIVQQAARVVLEPLLDRLFLDVSYAYRKGKSAGRAIGRVQHLIVSEKREWLTLCDIDAYFDNINHDRLLSMLAKRINDQPFLNLIRVWLKMGRVDRNLHWTDSHAGIPQGGIISPLLSNFYLNSLDHFCVGKKMGYVRYADDFVVLSCSQEEAQQALRDITGFLLNRLNLRLNPDCGVKHINDGFQFLGIRFRGAERSISEEKLASLQEKIRNGVLKNDLVDSRRMTESLRGIGDYYARILPQRVLETLDDSLSLALKEKVRQLREDGVITNKKQLEELIRKVGFFSSNWQVHANAHIKEIAAFSRKREKRAESASGREASPPADPVRKRKKEYEKLESAGFEVVVSQSGSFIGKTKKGVIVKVRGQLVHQSPLDNLKHIFITAPGVTLSSNLVSWAAERRIPIDFNDFSGLPYARITSFNTTHYELQRAQLAAENDGKASHLATTFVTGKIKNQMNLVKYYHKYRKSFDEGFVLEFNDKTRRMENIMEEFKALNTPDHETLRGKLFSIEGRAAAAYWDIIKTLLDDNIVFEGRVGKGATDLVNSLLNYGYGILYGKIWNSVQRIGLNPYSPRAP
ncbi:MAG: CRISPR-associated endonuclease Cas1 [Deltaproteobacteria bacterium]|nr:CRISPR-associated endonuclease Cas1 [Deltaproteobacteria bacterium]